MNPASRLIRLFAAGMCAVLLVACGGGGGDGSIVAAPATGLVSNASGASVSSVTLGDRKFRLVVWPGESQEFPLTISSNEGIAFDVEVTLGGTTLTSIDRNGQHFLVVDATGLSAGMALPYKVRLRNRTSGAEAEVFGPINVLTPVVAGSATIGASGGDVVANAINTRVVFDALPGAQTLDVTLSVAVAPEGEQKVRIQFSQDVLADDRLMHLEEIAPTIDPLRASASQRARRLAAATGNDGYPTSLWSSGNGAFTENGSFRFDIAGKRAVRSWLQTCYRYDRTRVCYYLTTAWDLNSTIAQPPSGGRAVATTRPTIFVHGFQQDFSAVTLKGGADYWRKFPQLVERHVPGATAFEFRWSTNAKFEMVATDLAHAINLVHQKTGNKVTLIAHSFGGVLVRTLLEGMASTDVSSALANIDQVVTLGSPHSGIGRAANSVAAGFPGGQDSSLFQFCRQISCHQMGQPVSFVYGQPGVDLSGFLGLTDIQGRQVKAGDLAVRLRDGTLSANIRLAVGIGLARGVIAPQGQPAAQGVRGGDVLITLAGQRFIPTLGEPETAITDALAKCGSIDGKPVAEVLLGDDLKRASSDDWRVNMIFPAAYTRRGYVHSPGSVAATSERNFFEALVDDATFAACPAGAPTSCLHAGFRLVYEAMTEGICSLPVVTPIADASSTVGGSLSFTVAARGWHRLAYQWFRQRVGEQSELISGDTDNPAVVILSRLTAADDGAVVRVVVTNEVGRTETSAALHVLPGAIPPQIPVGGDLLDVSVVLGQAATYSVAATGTGPLSYQWKRNGIVIAGAAGPSYTTPATTLADSGSTFVVTVTNVAGSVTSRTATLTVANVGAAPAITSGPSSAAVQAGAPATFNVTAAGTQLSYEWRRGSPQSSVPAPGGTNNATYVTPATTLADNRSTFFVVVSNGAGAVISDVTTLYVLAPPPSGTTQLALTATPDPVRPGQLVQYAVTATNNSGNTQSYVVSAPVPNGMTVSASAISQNVFAGCGQPAVCPPGSVITWGGGGHPALVGPGQSVTVTFGALVDPARPPANGTVIHLTATAAGNLSGASAAVDVVVSTTDLSLGMVNESSPVAPGGALNYTLRFGNPGGGASAAAVLAVPLPSGVSFVSASNGGALSGGVVQWIVGAIAPGASGQRTLVVQVTPQAANGSVLTATADLRDAATGRSLARANAAAAVLSNSGTQMTLAAAPDPVRPGQVVQYAATVTNRTATTQNYVISAHVPNGMTVAASAISQNVFATCSGASVCGPGSVILWGSGGHPAAVGAGQSVTVTFAALVDAVNPLPNGTVVRSTAEAATAEGTGSLSGASAAVDVVVSQ